jgi:competence protein ComEC
MTYKSEIIFLRILLPFGFGIYVGYVAPSQNNLLLSIAGVVLLFSALLIVNLFYVKFGAYAYTGWIGLIFTAQWFTFGILICLIHCQLITSDHFANQPSAQLRAWVKNEPHQSGKILKVELQVTAAYLHKQKRNTSGKMSLSVWLDPKLPLQLNYGDEVMIPSNYQTIEPPYNPAQFDVKSWQAANNTYHQAIINQQQLLKLHTNCGNPLLKFAISLRKRQVDIYRKFMHNDEAFAVAATLVLGYRADLSREILATYSKTGTIHALSVSGMHVGIIYIFLNWALFFLDRNLPLKILKLVLITGLIWYYSLLTGFSPSVLRSAIMLSSYIIAKAFHKNSNSYNILAFTGFCLLCYNPFLIWDVGFELSFLAVFGLIYLQPKIYNWFYVKNKWLDQLWSTVALSLAAQFATFPLSIYYFHQFPLYFIFSNLFILLPLTVMMYLGITILILKLYFLIPIFEWTINFTNAGLKWIADLPFSGLTSIWITPWQLAALSLLLGLFAFAFTHYRKKMLVMATLMAIAYQTFSAYQKMELLRQRKIIFFSLKRNYAAAFITADSAYLLTDLASSDKNYDFNIRPALDQLQISKIRVIKWKDTLTSRTLVKNRYQLSFHTYRLMLINDDFKQLQIRQMPKFNAVWFHHNPKKRIVALSKEVNFKLLLIDGTNKEYLIKKFKSDVNKVGIAHYTLHKNKAYLIDLNKEHE